MDERDIQRRLVEAVDRTGRSANVGEVRRLTGGTSSLTYAARLDGDLNPGGGDVVIKVAPPGLPPVKNRDVLRQARLMKALRDEAAVRLPEVLLEDAGDPPDTPPLFVMSFIDGDCFEPISDAAESALPPDELRSRMMDTARQLAGLQSVKPSAVGLADEPIVSVEGELERWERLILSIDEGLRPDAEEVAGRLRSSLPEPMSPVIVHGDYRLGNMLASKGRVNAIVDWEIWSIGDPRIDLSWFLMNTSRAKLPTARQDAEGMPTDQELLEEYCGDRGEVPNLGWFNALTQFKGAAVVSSTIKHNRRSKTPNAQVSSWGPQVPIGFLTNAKMLLADLP